MISEHIKNIFEEQELDKNSTVGNFPTVQIEGNRRVNRKGIKIEQDKQHLSDFDKIISECKVKK